MSRLSDGTIVPSFLQVSARGQSHAGPSLLTNYVLRHGEVKQIVLPDDPESQLGETVEYVVEVSHREEEGPTASTIYRGVTALNALGGSADRTVATYRPDNSGSEKAVGDGSRVLLLCVSGDQSKAVILGGMQPLPTSSDSEKGHHYTFEFNGAYFNVNNEGEVQFVHKGPTNADGSVQEQYQDYGGANVRFDKNGDVIVSAPGGEQYFKLNHKDNQTELQADKKLLITSHGQTEVVGDDYILIKSKNAHIEMLADQGVQIGEASNAMLLADVYRQAEGLSNQTVAKSLHAASTAANTAGASLLAAAPLNAIPMVGGVLALPALIAAANALIAVGVSMNVAATAIDALENNYDKYLSPKNRND
jgi:hypothetical protein